MLSNRCTLIEPLSTWRADRHTVGGCVETREVYNLLALWQSLDMVQEFVAYVDEAGDEGFGKLREEGTTGQSRWLMLGAIILSKENDRFAPSWRDEIMALFPNKNRRDLHFRFLNHEQRVAACDLLSQKRFGACVVASNKETILDLDSRKKDVFKKKGHLYNYLVRFLLERVTEAVARAATRANDTARLSVTFSRRGGTDYQSMRDYLCLMRDGREVLQPVRSINWNVFDPAFIRVENHSIRAGLQLSDVVTSATASALDPNRFGHIEPRYATQLKDRYITKGNVILNTGVTLIPPVDRNPLSDAQREFINTIKRK